MSSRLLALSVVGLFLGFVFHLTAADPEPVYDGKQLSDWIQLLQSPKQEERRQAADAIGALANQTQAGLPALMGLIFDKGTGKWNDEAMRAVVHMGPAAVPHLTKALWADDPPVQWLAGHMLHQLGDRARPAIPSLIDRLKDGHPLVQRVAAETLGDLHARAAIPTLLSKLPTKDVELRQSLVLALLNMEVEAKTVIPVFQQWLTSDDVEKRRLAARSLGHLGREAAPAVPSLLKATQDADRTMRSAAVQSLARIGPLAKEAIPALKAGLQDPKWEDGRLGAAEALWIIAQHEDVVPALKAILKEDDPKQQLATAKLLWRINQSPEAVETLAEILSKGDPDQRYTAAEILRQIGPGAQAAVPSLVAQLKDKDVRLRTNVLVALGRIGPGARAASAAIAECQKTEQDPWNRLSILIARWRIDQDPTVLAPVAEFLQNKEPDLRRTAAQFLGTLGPNALKSVSALEGVLKDAEPYVRMSAAAALWQINKHPAALPTVAQVLTAREPRHRVDGAVWLGVLGRADPSAAFPALQPALWDSDAQVRSLTAEALARLGAASRPAVRPLTVLLGSDEEDHVLSAVAEALGQIGPPAKNAVPLLRDRLKHPDAYVRVHAALALWNIGGDATGLEVAQAGLTDRMVRARIVAAETAWRIKQDPRALETLREVLREAALRDDPAAANEQYMAARTLGRIGPPAQALSSLLQAQLHHEDDYLRVTVREALEKIDPEAARKLKGP